MSPSNPTDPRFSSPESRDRLLDALRGELTASGQEALDSRLASDEALRAERDRLAAFLATARAVHEVEPDQEAALRLSSRIRAQIGAEEARARRESARPSAVRRVWSRLAWGRILGVSVAVHLLVLGFLTVRVYQHQEDQRRITEIGFTLPREPGYAEDGVGDPIPKDWQRSGFGQVHLPDTDRLARLLTPETVDEELEPLTRELREHPEHLAFPMLVRRHAALKRASLDAYGLDGVGTLAKVGRGLRALTKRQRPDGSFPEGGDRSTVGQTALALLPFLGDGSGSRTGESDVVTRGVAWLRARLFWSDTGPERGLDGERPADLGIALRTLSEDYVLSYGHLLPAEARRRASELRLLAEHVQSAQAPNGGFPGGATDVRLAVWPMWGLEAAVRSGAVSVPKEVPARFRTWYATTADGDPRVAAAGLLLTGPLGGDGGRIEAQMATISAEVGADDPFFLATAGAGLLLTDPQAFRSWNERLGESVARTLGSTGVVRHGDEVGDTALVLLALQTAYRTY